MLVMSSSAPFWLHAHQLGCYVGGDAIKKDEGEVAQQIERVVACAIAAIPFMMNSRFCFWKLYQINRGEADG